MQKLSESVLMAKDDSVLAELAGKGDNDSLRLLLARYEPYIRACCRNCSNLGIDTEDLMQEGRLGLISATRRFRSDRGASFKTFAYLCIKRQITTAFRHARRGKNLPMNDFVSLDDTQAKVRIAEIASVNPEDVVISMERLAAIRNALTDMFSPLERKLFLLYLSGYTYESMASQLNICKKQVDNTLQRMKRKLVILFG